MCGIVGLIALRDDAPAPAPGVVQAMCDTIVHRGPDDQGVYSGQRAHIGMRRLAIIDVPGGHQPMASDDQRVQLVFNGEIYNFRELRAELIKLGHRFHSDSDSEVVLQAYRAWGDEAVARLRGMFALCIVDHDRNRTLLARDRIGKKPLYFSALSNGQFAFASELKALHQVPGFDKTLNHTAMRDYFTYGYVPAPASIYSNTSKLPPAHLMVLENQRVIVSDYGSIDFGPKFTEDEPTLQAMLAAEIEEAVKVRLVSDVPFGAFLSGGTDSSVVCALMARNLSQPLKTFTIGFNERRFDEMPDARRVAEHIGAEHHELVVSPDAVQLAQDLSWFYDEPFGDSSSIPTFVVSRLAAQHVKMVLSGDGGDELFAGYSRYQHYRQLSRLNKNTLGLAGPLLAGASHFLGKTRGNRFQRIANRLRQDFPDQYLSGVALSTRDDLQLLFGEQPSADQLFGSLRGHFSRHDIAEPLERVLYGDMRSYLVDDILVKVDRATMANSLEARAPLLDQKLIKFSARLPFDTKLRGNTGKYLFKQIARTLLPAEVMDKPKQGFAIPLDDWFRGELKPLLLDTFASAGFRQRGLFNQAGVQTLVNQHMAGTHQRGEMLWLLLGFELWAQRFGYDLPAMAQAA
ncbi:MAG: asparagine synthase (glutamine-hydrolyzing) [Burkholderiaceae bacterium]